MLPVKTLRHPVADNARGVLDVINRAGAEACRIAVGAIPIPAAFGAVIGISVRAVGHAALV